MERLFLLLHARSAITLILSLSTPFLFGFLLYQVNYPFILIGALARHAFGVKDEPPLTADDAPAALLVLPTLLRNDAELAGLKRAISSAVDNGYPGQLIIVAAIDDAPSNMAPYRDLLAWMAALPRRSSIKLFATSTPRRTGKAVAIDNAIHFVRAKVQSGDVDAFPPVFFNMDGDSFLGKEALERMVQRLRRPRFGSDRRTRPMIVTSNVQVDPSSYWRGWRTFFTLRGLIAVSVAREYLTSITIGKYNSRLLPVTEASGALYCTWSELHERAPYWAAYMQTLTLGDWCRWWIGVTPPPFVPSRLAPCAEAQTGPGDDTWMTWLSVCARYSSSGGVVLELPRTPIHALVYGVQKYICRPVDYEPLARLHTKTPISAKGLFNQRVRWNSSRVADLQRWWPAFAYHWNPSFLLLVGMALNVYVHASVAWALLSWPFTHGERGGAFATFLLGMVLSFGVRGVSTVFALLIDGTFRRGWRTLLSLPVALPYHFVFNMLPTISGIVQDVVLFGLNTRFSPEETMIASGLSRIAIAYRVRRAFALATRSIAFGDVPFGGFWFGWQATEWTPNGFQGWTHGRAKVLLPRKAASVVVDDLESELESSRPSLSLLAPPDPSMLPAPRRAYIPPPLAVTDSSPPPAPIFSPPPEPPSYSNVVVLADHRAKVARRASAPPSPSPMFIATTPPSER